jgi:beta-lactamase class A
LLYSTSTADEINGVPFETPSNLQVGKSYTVGQLVEAMIINSDNGAKNALLDNINQTDLNDIYTDLGLPNPGNSDNYVISAKQYALLLRVLYNATYLSRDYSEQALKIMSQAKYSQGLVAGVPKGTVVAQKFGENVDASSNSDSPVISLSNCGVVYHPTHPYILCVMTKGTDINILTKTVASISGVVWNQVSSYAGEKN